MRRLTSRRVDERGVALSSPVALLSLGAVVLAGAGFVMTGHSSDEPPVRAATVAASAAPTTPAGSPSAEATTSRAPRPVVTHKPKVKKNKKRHQPQVRRGETYVEVYNNSGISGLAGSTAARAQGAGWQVVGSDNWYGTIPASTVYYPARLRDEALILARDLGIGRVKQAIAPMRGDRLTVILTRDYS